MYHVYLDQNKWIELSATALAKPTFAHLVDVLALARYGVERQLVSFPLSGFHYIETWGTKPWRQRGPLASIMAELSRFETMPPHRDVLAMELDLALRKRFGRPQNVRSVNLFDHGVGHAFGVPDLQLRLSAAVEAVVEQHPRLGRSLEEMWQFAALAGPPQDLPVPWLDSTSHMVYEDRYAEGEHRRSALFQKEGFGKGRLPRGLLAGEVVDIIDPLNEAFRRAGVSADALPDAEAITDFLMALPSRWTTYQMRLARHRNPQQPWKPNDLNDIGALSLAVPYCDVVVTERHWRGVLRAAHLDDAFGTVILDDLRELPAAIVETRG